MHASMLGSGVRVRLEKGGFGGKALVGFGFDFKCKPFYKKQVGVLLLTKCFRLI